MTEKHDSLMVIGAGPVGLTAAAAIAQTGQSVVLYDRAPGPLDAIQTGAFDDLFAQIGVDREALAIKYTTQPRWDVGAIVICVGTQRGGHVADMDELLRSVVANAADGLVLIVESTVPVGFSERTRKMFTDAGRDVSLVLAPRRDIFDGDPQRGLHGVPRVIGASDERGMQKAMELYSGMTQIVNTTLEVAEAVKPFENALLTYPLALTTAAVVHWSDRMDVTELLRVAGTHPRLPKYFADAGVAGYCVPVAPRYLGDLPGAEFIAELIVSFDETIVQALQPPVLFVGARFKRSEPVFQMSHTDRFVTHAARLGIGPQSVWDPLLGRQAIEALSLDWHEPSDPESGFRTVVNTAWDVPPIRIENAKVIDVTGSWDKARAQLEAGGCTYTRPGFAGWLL